jgi:hypothetical protein
MVGLGWELLENHLEIELEETLDLELVERDLEVEMERRRDLGSLARFEGLRSTLSEAGAVDLVLHCFEEALLIPACFAESNSGYLLALALLNLLQADSKLWSCLSLV